MKKIAIYYRVSTDKQDLSSQRIAVERFLEEQKDQPEKITVFEEEGYSGKNTQRPAFHKMMALVTTKKIDTIVVYRLDRFSRDANMAIKTILELDQYGVGFVSVTQPVLNLGHDNPFRRTLLAAFAEIAEIERETIVARVRAGLEAAKKRGVRLGAPPKISTEKRSKVLELRSGGMSMKKIAETLEISAGTVHKLVHIAVDDEALSVEPSVDLKSLEMP